MRSVAFLVLLISQFSCVTSSWVEKRFQPDKGGIVKFSNNGADFVINQRRQKAYTAIQSFCGGEYKINRETNDSSVDGFVTQPNAVGDMSMSYATRAEFTFIHFTCGKN